MGHPDDPSPPGGPQREDAPSPGARRDSGEPERHPEAVSSPDPSDDEVDTHPDDRDLQQENAETSLDQPSQ